MQYLSKSAKSQIIENKWQYPKDAKKIRNALLKEQFQFCAYSERYIKETDAVDVEHFDGRLKQTSHDNYWNWYAVLHWLNIHKPRKIEDFEPLLEPYSKDMKERIKYEGGQFISTNRSDIAAENLIKYLGWNRPELTKDRNNHIKRMRFIQKAYGDNHEAFQKCLTENPDNMSFFSALTVEFNLADVFFNSE